MAGGLHSGNLAGALVVHNCEALAGLILAQTTRRGAKFIYGSSSTAMDLRYGAAVVHAGTGRAQRRGRGYGPLLQAALLGGGG